MPTCTFCGEYITVQGKYYECGTGIGEGFCPDCKEPTKVLAPYEMQKFLHLICGHVIPVSNYERLNSGLRFCLACNEMRRVADKPEDMGPIYTTILANIVTLRNYIDTANDPLIVERRKTLQKNMRDLWDLVVYVGGCATHDMDAY